MQAVVGLQSRRPLPRPQAQRHQQAPRARNRPRPQRRRPHPSPRRPRPDRGQTDRGLRTPRMTCPGEPSSTTCGPTA
eukprot:9142915-Alexandrium_andersonii.AAC.1